MKTTFKYALLMPAMLLFWVGCNTLSPDGTDLTDEEIQIAAQIVAESLADESGGMLSSFYDALSTVGQDGISYGSGGEMSFQFGPGAGTPPIAPGNANGRGIEREFNAVYNPETGEHIVRFLRSVNNGRVTMTQTVSNTYIYRDVDGGFLEFPRRTRDQIASITFFGRRTGSQTGPVRQATSTRTDTLFVSGLLADSPAVLLDGVHYHEGRATVVVDRSMRSAERSFSNVFRLEDVRIDKAIVRDNGNLENGVTGLISYSLSMNHTKPNGETETRDIQGVIELDGDGTALLRFGGVSNIFRIALATGEID